MLPSCSDKIPENQTGSQCHNFVEDEKILNLLRLIRYYMPNFMRNHNTKLSCIPLVFGVNYPLTVHNTRSSTSVFNVNKKEHLICHQEIVFMQKRLIF